MSFISVIPARGGSKAIPKKNLVKLNGQPLISYTIKAALDSKLTQRVLVSTDDIEIANISKAYGAEVPFIRPNNLARDTSPMVGVLQHALTWLENNGDKVQALILLQPTSPLRHSKHIDEAISLYMNKQASSIVSVVEVPHQFNPVSVQKITKTGVLKPFHENQKFLSLRQEKPVVFARNGPAILVCNPETLKTGNLYGNRCFPYHMNAKESIDIDLKEDLIMAEQALSQ